MEIIQKKTCSLICSDFREYRFGLNEREASYAHWRRLLRGLLCHVVADRGVERICSGVELGAGLFAAEQVLKLKRSYPKLELKCILPYEEYTVQWPENFRNRYFTVLRRCDEVVFLQNHYTPDCIARQHAVLRHQAQMVFEV